MMALLRPHQLDAGAIADLERVRQDCLQAQLRQFRVLGLLGSRLLAWVPQHLTPEFSASVTGIVDFGRRAAGRNQILTWAILRLLGDNGIAAVPLKGPFLAERLHGDGGLRISRDIDILVRPRDLSRAASVLATAGYSRPPANSKLPLLHHKLEVPCGMTIDLHWRVHWYEDTHAEQMLSRAVVADDLRQLTPTDDLISLLLIYSRDGLVGLSAPADIAAWWVRYGDKLDREDFAATVASYPRLAPAIRAGAMMVTRLTGVPVAEHLPNEGSARRRTAFAVGIASDRLFDNDMTSDTLPKLQDALLDTSIGNRRYLRRTLLPPLPGEGYHLRINQVLYDFGLIGRIVGLLCDWLGHRSGTDRQ